MMERILLAAFFGTTVMTLFSYIVSGIFHKLFKEPELLMAVITGLRLKTHKNAKQLFAWMIHYAIGLFFVIVYDYLLKTGSIEAVPSDAILFGIGIGITGILGWKLLFRISVYKPRHPITALAYYTQLFIAHLLFAISVFGVYSAYFYFLKL